MAIGTERTCASHTADTADTAAIALPVLPDARPGVPMRKSRMGRRRAIVLGAVQLLLIGHVIHWLVAGRTMTPLEPSEAIATSREGIINAGAILFAIALLSTLILGRWFCGWGCHVLLLQDLCGWMMKKAGIRPKPFRSRLLLFAPLLLGLYMFAWPLVYRFAILPWLDPASPSLAWPGFEFQLTTTDFWRTFPGVAIAVPFLLICGFATVYILGQKGYCTYACPYGGFFAPLDEFAPARIRVTSDCEQCGHCTAVCTSNVRVHEEVRDFGMVVDPGCMKCMDCVSVCPKDALYFGWGKPAAFVSRRSEATSRRQWLAWPQEIALAMIFAVTFLSVRGVYSTLALLFASGIAAVVTGMVWLAWRTLRDRDSHLHRFQLKRSGRLRPVGVAWLALTGATALLVAHSGAVNAASTVAAAYDRRVTLSSDLVFSPNAPELDATMLARIDRALAAYRLSSSLRDGGIGLLRRNQAATNVRMAWLLACRQDHAEAEALFRHTVDVFGPSDASLLGVGRTLHAQGKLVEEEAWYRAALERMPDAEAVRDALAAKLERDGRVDEATTLCRVGLEIEPSSLLLMRRLSLLLSFYGSPAERDEGIALIRRTIELEPSNANAHAALAQALIGADRLDEAETAYRRAVELAPEAPLLNQAFGQFLVDRGRADEARRYFNRALRPHSPGNQ